MNVLHTLRSWLIGYRIQKYEQSGKDRAKYGEKIIDALAKQLAKEEVPGCAVRRLWEYRQFYQVYPEIQEIIVADFKGLLNQLDMSNRIMRTVSAQFDSSNSNEGTVKKSSLNITDMKALFYNLSFSHFLALIKIEDSAKRGFYELEASQSTWSFRELKRQIASLLYERTVLSKDKKPIEFTNKKIEKLKPKDIIREPYIFEFLDIKPHEALVEYALSGMSNQLFVSKYQFALPAKEKLQNFLKEAILEDDFSIKKKQR